MRKCYGDSIGDSFSVKIPTYMNVSDESIDASLSSLPNSSYTMSNDVVFYENENNDTSAPVILGELASSQHKNAHISSTIDTVQSDLTSVNSIDIDGITEKDIYKLYGAKKNIQSALDLQSNNIAIIEKSLGDYKNESNLLQRVDEAEKSFKTMNEQLQALTDSFAKNVSAITSSSIYNIATISSIGDSSTSISSDTDANSESISTDIVSPILNVSFERVPIAKEDCVKDFGGINAYVHVPENAYMGMPVVVYFHGIWQGAAIVGSGGKKHIYRAAIENYGDNYPCIILMPSCGSSRGFYAYGWAKKFMKFFQAVREYYKVDKVALTGHSLGAMSVWWYAQNHPELFYRAAPVAGYPGYRFNGDIDIPILSICGTGDSWAYQKQKSAVNKMISKGKIVSSIWLPKKGHSISRIAYTKDVFEWLVSR